MTHTNPDFQRDYERDGFLIHPHPIVAPELLARAINGFEAVLDGEFETGESPAGASDPAPQTVPRTVAEILRCRRENPNSLGKVEQPQLANCALREIIASPQLGALAAHITGAQMVQVWWVQLLDKPSLQTEAQTTNVGWHQDKQYWKSWDENSELFTAWLALSDVTPDAGPMCFVPGSQHWGLLDSGDFFAGDQDVVRENIAVPTGQKWTEVPGVLGAGGVSFHQQLTFHGSHRNTSGRPRRSLAIHLRTEKSHAPPDSWVAQYLDRNEICPIIFDGTA